MKQLNKNDWLILISLIVVQLVGIFIISRFIISRAETTLEEKKKLTALEKRINSLVKLQEDYFDLEEDLGIIDEALPNKERMIEFINQIEVEASASGLLADVAFSNQSVKTEAKGIKSLAFSLNFEATYFEMIGFVKKIEKMPQVVAIDSINIQSPGGITTKNNVTLYLRCYVDPEF